MKIIQKLALVLFTLFICQYQLIATSHTHFTKNLIDTIPQVEPNYNGNRILVKSIKVIKKKGKSYKIEYKLVNNGRNKIKLGKSKLIPEDLVIQFDESLQENDLVDAKSSIIENIKKQSISIRPGQLIMGNKLKFTHRSIPSSDRIANESEKSNQSIQEEKVEDQIIVKEENPTTKFDEAVKDIVEEVPLPDSELENPRTLSQSTSPREENQNQEISLGETILVKENKSSENLGIIETESILDVSTKEKTAKEIKELVEAKETQVIDPIVKDNVEKNLVEAMEAENINAVSTDKIEKNSVEVVEVENIDAFSSVKVEKDSVEVAEAENLIAVATDKIETDSVEVVDAENIEAVATDKNEEKTAFDIFDVENLQDENSNEKLCADLIIEDAEIVKKNKRYVLLKYTIKNVGNYPISMHGKTKKETDNIAIQSHFTRSHKLTRGSIPVDFSFIKKGNRDVKGMLAPGESISKKLKVEISKMTKFTPVLALTLNPSATNVECSRLNNIFFIDIAEKAPKSVPKKPLNENTVEKITTLEN